MKFSIELILSIWGSVIATATAIHTLVKTFREKPRINIAATIIRQWPTKGKHSQGVVIETRKNLFEEINVEISIKNSGHQPCQIINIFIETDEDVHEVCPDGLPCILTPNTSVSLSFQPECFAPCTLVFEEATKTPALKYRSVIAVGVFDGLGKKYKISQANLASLLEECRALPLRQGIYKDKETGEVVAATQTKHKGRYIKKQGVQMKYP